MSPEIREEVPFNPKIPTQPDAEVADASAQADSEQGNSYFSMKNIAAAGAMVLTIAAGAPETAQASQTERLQISRNIANALARTQQPSGHLYNVLHPKGESRYGDAMGGLALIQTGVRDHNPRLTKAGIKAINYTTKSGKPDSWYATRPFKIDGIASSYNVLKSKSNKTGYETQALKKWGKYIKVAAQPTYLGMKGYENKYLVDATAVLETQATGLKSKDPNSIVGKNRKNIRKQAKEIIDRKIPASVSTTVVSDVPHFPPAYAALSQSYAGRAVMHLKGSATNKNRALLREMAETAEQMAGPDGSVSYMGRSYGQRWGELLAAEGLAIAARQKGTSPARSLRYNALAERLTSKAATYGAGPKAEWINPAMSQDSIAGRKSLDPYAYDATGYSALAAVAANRANALLGSKASSATSIAADGPGTRVISQGTGRFSTTTNANGMWYAVRERALGNLRFDSLLMAFKRRQPDGSWKDVIPLRPNDGGTAGPALMNGTGVYMPSGDRITAGRDGGVYISGGFRNMKGQWLRRGVNFNVKPTPERCMKTSVENTQPGDRYQMSGFFRGSEAPVRDGNAFYGKDGQVLKVEGGTIVGAGAIPGYSSASDARLTRQIVVVQADGDKPVSKTDC